MNIYYESEVYLRSRKNLSSNFISQFNKNGEKLKKRPGHGVPLSVQLTLAISSQSQGHTRTKLYMSVNRHTCTHEDATQCKLRPPTVLHVLMYNALLNIHNNLYDNIKKMVLLF